MSSNFDIDREIDALVDKLAEQLKTRLHRLVERSEKQVLKQYQATMKNKQQQGKAKKVPATSKRQTKRASSDLSDSETGSGSE